MEMIKEHFADISIVIIVGIIMILAIRKIIKRKGKCAYCKHADTCPFKVEKK